VKRLLAAHKAAGRKQTDPLFLTTRGKPMSRKQFWRLMQRYGKRAGLPPKLCHPHILKHSICSQSIHTAGIENVRRHAGHKSLASTGFYLIRDQREAAQEVFAAVKSRQGRMF
jgi:site-specific recombinase XerD